VFHLAVRARIALRTVLFQLPVRAGVALRALEFLLAVRAGVAPRHDSARARSVIHSVHDQRVFDASPNYQSLLTLFLVGPGQNW
jgi:hypothetical protein